VEPSYCKMDCTDCNGTGYRLDNEICNSCSEQHFQENISNLKIRESSNSSPNFQDVSKSSLRNTLGFNPMPDCQSCYGTGYRSGQGSVICLICPTKNYQPSQNNQTGVTLKDKLGVYPDPSCLTCNGTGYIIGTNSDLCTICPTSEFQSPQQFQTQNNNQSQSSTITNKANTENNSFKDETLLMNKPGYYANPSCEVCNGSGYKSEKNGQICLCAENYREKQTYATTEVPMLQKNDLYNSDAKKKNQPGVETYQQTM